MHGVSKRILEKRDAITNVLDVWLPLFHNTVVCRFSNYLVNELRHILVLDQYGTLRGQWEKYTLLFVSPGLFKRQLIVKCRQGTALIIGRIFCHGGK